MCDWMSNLLPESHHMGLLHFMIAVLFILYKF